MTIPLKNLLISIVGSVGALTVVASVTFFAYHFMSSPNTPHDFACKQVGPTQVITVKTDRFEPTTPTFKRCDQLQFVNDAAQLRLIAFGEHDQHQAYDGVTERVLEQGQSFTIVLNKPGTLLFHDHLQPALHGTVTITQ